MFLAERLTEFLHNTGINFVGSWKKTQLMQFSSQVGQMSVKLPGGSLSFHFKQHWFCLRACAALHEVSNYYLACLHNAHSVANINILPLMRTDNGLITLTTELYSYSVWVCLGRLSFATNVIIPVMATPYRMLNWNGSTKLHILLFFPMYLSLYIWIPLNSGSLHLKG